MQIINKLDKSTFISKFGNVFEGSNWIAENLYKSKPFLNFDDLKYKMIYIFNNTTKKNQLNILINHPDLADKTKISALTKDSFNEQKSSKLDECSENEFNEFKSLNTKYKKKFGFPFILAVSGKTKDEILTIFRSRYLLDKNNEFNQAKSQVIKIATLRLDEIKRYQKI